MSRKQNIINGIMTWLGLTTTKESQQSQTSAQGTESNSQSLQIERDIIPDSPFTIVGSNKTGYWLTMGKHRITQAYKTKKEVKKRLKKLDWTIVTSMIIAFVYDRKLVDEAYTKNTGIPPDEKHKVTSTQPMMESLKRTEQMSKL